MSLRETTITVTVTVSVSMIIAGRAMLATTSRDAAATATAATGNRRRHCLGFALLPVLSEFRQHVPQLMIAQMHLCQILSA
jgi:hypothetical protein